MDVTQIRMTMSKVRAKNLSQDMVVAIQAILDEWEAPLTWQSFIDEVTHRTGQTYTRQALDRHIGDSFSAKKKFLGGLVKSRKLPGNSKLEVALRRQGVLESDKRKLEQVNERLLEKFARWAYNAHTRGITLDILERPLPPRLEVMHSANKKNKQSSGN